MSMKKKKIEDALNGLFSSAHKTTRMETSLSVPDEQAATDEVSVESQLPEPPQETIVEAAISPEITAEAISAPLPASESLIPEVVPEQVMGGSAGSAQKTEIQPPAEASTIEPASPPQEPVSMPELVTDEKEKAGGEEFQIVVFMLNGQYYGTNISVVESIIKMQAITEVPHAHYYVQGLTNLRGTVLPVIDLRRRFGLSTVENTKDSRIIVLMLHHDKVGIIVDSVSEVLTISESDVEPPPPMVTSIDSTFLTGIAKTENQLIMLLDLEKVLFG